MKQSILKKTTLSLAMIGCSMLSVSPVFAGHESSGGGDLCEDRIKVIRDDLSSWIHNGGPKGLSLPAEISVELYSEAMLKSIKNARLKCVGLGDRDYPVAVNGTPKVCRFESIAGDEQIICDYQKFLASREADQYVLIHHEYAGLAGIERPIRDDSRYEISNQISGYLADQIVKKLAVKPVTSATTRTWVTIDFTTILLKGTSAAEVESDCVRALSTAQYTGDRFANLHVQYGNGKKVYEYRPVDQPLDIQQTCKVVTYYAVESAALAVDRVEDPLNGIAPSQSPLSGEKRIVLAVRTDFSADVFTGNSKEEILDRCLESGLSSMIPQNWGYGNLHVVLNSLKERSYYNSGHSKDINQICQDTIDLAFRPSDSN